MKFDAKNKTELSISEVQQRLELLGCNLGKEARQGLYGEATAAAVAAFKHSAHLPHNDVLDQETWIALVDASLQLGERLLYLHMPHFEGKDVRDLQLALSSLGFACNNDAIFGPNTERALRDFQQNMAIKADGICTEETVLAIERLRHAWEGKRGVFIEGRNLGYTRAAEVLETTAICIFGTDKITRSIADKISNLAQATTPKSKVVSASLMANGPSQDMLMVGIRNCLNPDASLDSEDQVSIRITSLDDTQGFLASLQSALFNNANLKKRITIDVSIAPQNGQQFLPQQEQQLAIVILDAICSTLA